MFCVLLVSEEGSLWDLWALDWVQKRAECLTFCIGHSVTTVGQLPVSTDIEYEFSTRNPYNFLQVTYYKVRCSVAVFWYSLIMIQVTTVFYNNKLSVYDKLHSHSPLNPHQLEKLHKAAAAAHTYFVANPSHLEMRNNIEKYRRMKGVTGDAFQDREVENEKHWVRR